MSGKPYVKRLFAIAAVCIAAGTALGLLTAQIAARQEYRDTAQILGAAGRASPRMEDALMQALKQAASSDVAAGALILQKYNYTPGVFWSRNAFMTIGSGILLMLASGALLCLLEYFSDKKRKNRIEGLTSYLESFNLGRDTLLVRREDDFSRLEDELYKTVTELRQSRESALKERQSLADNLADISHQIKTPITSMSLMMQLLADGCNDEDAVYIEKLNRQLSRLQALVSSLLTLSRLDAGTLEIKREHVEVSAMLILAGEPVEDMLRRKSQCLRIPDGCDASFTGDLAWTAEAFLNLIKDCSEHTPDGGTISISSSQNPIYTEIIVEDSGAGFDKNDLPHLFERFYKGKNAAKDSAGIGLALSRSIIEKQNGTIRAENPSEGGARFIVKFYA